MTDAGLAFVGVIVGALLALAAGLGAQLIARRTERENREHEHRQETAKWQRERRRDLDQERRARLEKAYKLLEDVSESYSRIVSSAAIALHTGTLDKVEQKNAPWSELHMLVHFYLPQIAPLLEQSRHVAQEKVGRYAVLAWGAYKRDSATRDKLSDALILADNELKSALDKMRAALVAESQSLANRLQAEIGTMSAPQLLPPGSKAHSG